MRQRGLRRVFSTVFEFDYKKVDVVCSLRVLHFEIKCIFRPWYGIYGHVRLRDCDGAQWRFFASL